MGPAKMARSGQGAVNSRGKRQTNVHESAEKRKARVRTGRSWGKLLALQSAALSEDVLLLCDNAAVLCAIKKWVGQGGKATLVSDSHGSLLLCE